VLEVFRAIRAEVGPATPVTIKLNSADFQRGGFGEDESIEVVHALAAEGLNLLEISGGTYASAAMLGVDPSLKESTRRREAYFLSYAERVRAELPDLPLMLTGGFRTAEGMVDAVESGAVDIVAWADRSRSSRTSPPTCWPVVSTRASSLPGAAASGCSTTSPS
jgi:2,4-dienoyl-CoA reductase-like NADH-dependent reductase (Old Yellow Enzyme family)